ncbi:hypothetical protein PQC55_gp002 [Escherichia phage vB_EcoP-CHD5UKE1]|uniref:Uncharacterized protein n=1 Tax=Escherichia phage vB_EcoP-CHD5UKE1 TaxID=2865805 RepID=A0ABX9AJF3_9CAUD|nr:hypothetical protein PQC55_gp002 [Escherichia phage vB_EcoP-CHD5UKE1]QZI80498.1 hypothetical protein CHD5UKE1_002 [Escherichia phage vB_EcoP-CHD5UKE1]
MTWPLWGCLYDIPFTSAYTGCWYGVAFTG